MSWITAVWSMNAAACLTLAGFYFAIWCKQRQRPMYLVFSCSAIAAAAISAFELWMLNAKTVDEYESLVRWIHVPTWVLTLSFVAFVAAFMARYGSRINAVEMWNEPDGGQSLVANNPAQYVQSILIPGYKAVKAARPAVNIGALIGHTALRSNQMRKRTRADPTRQ